MFKIMNADTAQDNVIHGKPITDLERLILSKLNEKYIQVVISGSHRILIKKPCLINGWKYSFEKLSEFLHYFSNLDKVAGMNQGEAWLCWSGKIFYPDGVGYYPSLKPDQLPDGVFNLYPGFACEAVSGDISLILYHIKNVLCGGDEKASEYVLDWLAHLVQKPQCKPSVAILLKGIEGTGKGTIYRLLHKILGANSVQLNGHSLLTGRFNSILSGKTLIFCDEVDLKNKKVFDKIKSIISEEYCVMELKGMEATIVNNFARFIFASNHEQILLAGSRERRFLVLEPSSEKVGDLEYWGKLYDLIENDGGKFFLDFLLKRNIEYFNPYLAPITLALIDEKLASLRPSQSFLYEELCKEQPFSNALKLDSLTLVTIYSEWLKVNNEFISIASARSQIGKLFADLGIKTIGRSGRNLTYELFNKSEFQDHFAKLLGHIKEEIF